MSYYNLLSTHIKTGQPTKTQATFVYVQPLQWQRRCVIWLQHCAYAECRLSDFTTCFCAAQWTLASSRHKHIRHSVVKRGRSVTYDLSRHLAVASFLTLSCFLCKNVLMTVLSQQSIGLIWIDIWCDFVTYNWLWFIRPYPYLCSLLIFFKKIQRLLSNRAVEVSKVVCLPLCIDESFIT